MAAKPFVAARIPEDLNTKLEEYSKATGEGKTQVLINALSSYLNFSPQSKEASKDRLSILEERVADLERIIKEPPKQFSLLESIPVHEEEVAEPKPQVETDNDSDNIVDNKDDEEFSSGVINTDNEGDNISTETLDNKSDNTDDNKQSADSNSKKPRTSRVKPLPERGKLIYSGIKTKDVPALPGLENEDPKKIKTKLNNTKNTDRQATVIGPYIVALAPSRDASTRGKQHELLWDIYEISDNTLSA